MKSDRNIFIIHKKAVEPNIMSEMYIDRQSNKNISISEASEILNVSLLYMNKLLNDGDMSYCMMGTDRQINRRQLLDYKYKRDLNRRKALRRYTRLLQDNNFYS